MTAFPMFAAALSTIKLTFIDAAFSENQSTAQVTIPLTAEEGDLAFATSQIGGSLSTPPSWTECWNNPSERDTGGWVKVLEAGDPGSTVMFGSGGFNDNGVAIFRPSRPIKSLTPSPFNSENTTGNPSPQTVLASEGSATLVVFGVCASAGTNDPPFSDATPPFDAELTGNNADIRVGYKIYDSAPQDHTIDMDNVGAVNGLASGYVQIR